VAALGAPRSSIALNLGEFLRDNVAVDGVSILQRRFEICRHFLSVCLDLRAALPARGVFPTSFEQEAA